MIVELPYTTRKQLNLGDAGLYDITYGDRTVTAYNIFINNPAGDGISYSDDIRIPGEFFTNIGTAVQDLASNEDEIILENVMDSATRPVGITAKGSVKTVTDNPLFQSKCKIRIPVSVFGYDHNFIQSRGSSYVTNHVDTAAKKQFSSLHVDYAGNDIYIYSSLATWEVWNPTRISCAYVYTHLRYGEILDTSMTPAVNLYASPSVASYPRKYVDPLQGRDLVEMWYHTHLSIARERAYSSIVGTKASKASAYYNTIMPSEAEIHTIIASARIEGSRILDQQRALIRKPRYTTSNLAYKAVSDIGNWSNNGLAYMKDYAETSKLVKSFAETLKKTAKGKVKALASTFLAYHYGIRLAISDTLSLLEFLSKDSKRYRRISSLESYVTNGHTVTSRYNVFYDLYSDQVDELYRTLTELDSKLSLDNVWDLIPYSFVIDWFVNVGELLTNFSNYRDLISTYKILSSLRTDKVEINTEITVGGQRIPLYAKTYCRKVLPIMPTPIPAVVSTNPAPFEHTLEGAALTIQSF